MLERVLCIDNANHKHEGDAGLGEFFKYILPFMLVVNVIVFAHSFGHYVVAKMLGLEIKVISFGLGPTAARFQRNKGIWKICWLPIGGYVQTNDSLTDRGLILKNLSVTLYGPIFSIAFALCVFLIIFTTIGAPSVQAGLVVLVQLPVLDGFFAAQRALVWTWKTWGVDESGALASMYNSPGSRIMCLAAIWSSKFGLINMLPLPKLDGWKAFHLSIAFIAGPERAGKVKKWALRGVAMLVILAFGYFVWSDLIRL